MHQFPSCEPPPYRMLFSHFVDCVRLDAEPLMDLMPQRFPTNSRGRVLQWLASIVRTNPLNPIRREIDDKSWTAKWLRAVVNPICCQLIRRPRSPPQMAHSLHRLTNNNCSKNSTERTIVVPFFHLCAKQIKTKIFWVESLNFLSAYFSISESHDLNWREKKKSIETVNSNRAFKWRCRSEMTQFAYSVFFSRWGMVVAVWSPSLNAATHSNNRRRWEIESVTLWGNVSILRAYIEIFFSYSLWLKRNSIGMEYKLLSHFLSKLLSVLAIRNECVIGRKRFMLTLTTVQAIELKHRTRDDTSIETKQKAETKKGRHFFVAATNEKQVWNERNEENKEFYSNINILHSLVLIICNFLH